MIRKLAENEWGSHPFAIRTWLRGRLPYFLVNLGVSPKGRDCEAVGASHLWYNNDDVSSACYHCEVVRPGRLWESQGHEH